MNANARTILLVAALILTILSAFSPVPVWVSVLLVEIALLIPA